MHPSFVNVSGNGVITLTRQSSVVNETSGGGAAGPPTITFADGTTIASVASGAHSVVVSNPINMSSSVSPGSAAQLIGSHFLTSGDGRGGIDPSQVTKIEVVEVPSSVEVVTMKKEKGGQHVITAHHSSTAAGAAVAIGAAAAAAHTIDQGERKVCLWPTGSGATCGKTFSKFDSLKRHLAEAHKGVRPFHCNLCDKSYGRKDYLQRHLKSHTSAVATPIVSLMGSSSGGGGGSTNNFPVNLVSTHGSSPGAAGATKVQVSSKLAPSVIVVQHQTVGNQSTCGGGGVQPHHHHHQQSPVATIITQQPPPPQSQQGPSVPSAVPAAAAAATLPLLSLTTSLPPQAKMTGKICRWVLNDGTVCGRSFSKLDSLRRHVAENHKGIRPFACTLCEKSYGRRDYLDRHMRTHEARKHKTEPGLDWGPNSGVLVVGPDGVPHPANPPPPKVPKKKRKDSEIPPEEKKICLWVLDDGTACGKTFTKFDSLKRHVSELHKSVRPFSCTLCGKNYGRRDYLLRHLRSHAEAGEVASIGTARVVQQAVPLVSQLVNNSPQSSAVSFHQHQQSSSVSAIAAAPPSAITGQQQHHHHHHHQQQQQQQQQQLQQQQQHTAQPEHHAAATVIVQQAHPTIVTVSANTAAALSSAGSIHLGSAAALSSAGSIHLGSPPRPPPSVQALINSGVSPLILSAASPSPGLSPPAAAPAASVSAVTVSAVAAAQLHRQQSPPPPPPPPQQQITAHRSVAAPIMNSPPSVVITAGSGSAAAAAGGAGHKKKRSEDKKTCKWVLENGTICGRSFSKFDSLRRHINELHKGVRPFLCTLCDKSYGRRDYLDRHIRSHQKELLEDNKAGIPAGATVTIVQTGSDGENVILTA